MLRWCDKGCNRTTAGGGQLVDAVAPLAAVTGESVMSADMTLHHCQSRSCDPGLEVQTARAARAAEGSMQAIESGAAVDPWQGKLACCRI